MNLETIKLVIGLGLLCIPLMGLLSRLGLFTRIKKLWSKKPYNPPEEPIVYPADEIQGRLQAWVVLYNQAPNCCKKDLRDMLAKLVEGDHEH